MEFYKDIITLDRYGRGFHLITNEIIRGFKPVSKFKSGVCHIFMEHTSAALTINENADPTVRTDFASFFSRLVPENLEDYVHNYEGTDDMPAHLKASLLGNSVTIPIENGALQLGTWQGIYYCEFRNSPMRRNMVCSAWGVRP